MYYYGSTFFKVDDIGIADAFDLNSHADKFEPCVVVQIVLRWVKCRNLWALLRHLEAYQGSDFVYL